MCGDKTSKAERERLMQEWANLFDRSLLEIYDILEKYRENPRGGRLVSKQCGSFNFSVRAHWDDGGPDWLIRFPIPGKALFAEEKFQNEVATMRFIRQNTSIPIPEIIAYGTAAENPTGLGPFMIMTWIEGTRMKELIGKKVPGTDDAKETILDPDIDEDMLKTLYSEVAQVLLQLWSLDLDKIGSLTFDHDANLWKVNRRPLTLSMNESIRLGGLHDDDFPHLTFSSSYDYFFYLAELHLLHLAKQRNSIYDSRDCRARYTGRRLFKSIIPFFTSQTDINGPFKLFCDDFGPGNILVDPSTLEITGIIDWEFCYAAPAQFLASPPDWLLLKNTDHWMEDEGLESFMKTYIPRLDLLIQAIEHHEGKQALSNACGKLSSRMRQSMGSKQIWFNSALLNGWSVDFLYWDILDNYIYGSASMTERVARVTSGSDLYSDREAFVRSKVEDLNRYNAEFGDGEQIEYSEEEEDEKREYWVVQHKVSANSLSCSHKVQPWWHISRRIPVSTHIAIGSSTIGFVATAVWFLLRYRFKRK